MSHHAISYRERISITSAAHLLSVSTATLRNWDKSGRLQAQRTEAGWRFYSRTQLRLFQKSMERSDPPLGK